MLWKGLDTPGHVRWATLPAGAVATWPVDGVQGVREAEGRELATLAACVSKWGELVRKHAAASGVPKSWIYGFMVAESGGNAAALSPAGAIGLMQIMPMHARGRNLRDPDTNIMVACELLAEMRQHGFDLPEAASAYNAGPGKDWRPKTNPVFYWGLKEEVPERLRGTLVWGSYYISTVVRVNNARAIQMLPGASDAAGGVGAAGAFLAMLALLFFAGELL